MTPRISKLENKGSVVKQPKQYTKYKVSFVSKNKRKIIPRKIQISSFVNGEFFSIILEINRVDYPDELTIPFKFPEGYSKIKL